MELGPLIKDAFPENSDISPQGVLRLNGRGASSGRQENLRPQFYRCSTAAKKNDAGRLVIQELAKPLRPRARPVFAKFPNPVPGVAKIQ